jgi:hypothetical protein
MKPRIETGWYCGASQGRVSICNVMGWLYSVILLFVFNETTNQLRNQSYIYCFVA